MEGLIYALVVILILGFADTLRLTIKKFRWAIEEPGYGRISFLSHVTLKGWVTIFLIYIVIVRTPLRPSDAVRDIIVVALALLLLAQVIGVRIALYRWPPRGDGEA